MAVTPLDEPPQPQRAPARDYPAQRKIRLAFFGQPLTARRLAGSKPRPRRVLAPACTPESAGSLPPRFSVLRSQATRGATPTEAVCHRRSLAGADGPTLPLSSFAAARAASGQAAAPPSRVMNPRRFTRSSSARASSAGGISQPARFPKDRKLREESRFVICCHCFAFACRARERSHAQG
jgi:hypothetical protein